FWFALLSTITPPVCGAVFIAAGMVGANWLRVAFSAMALGIGLYVIPLAMIANPAIVGLETQPAMALVAAMQLFVGLAALSYGLIGTWAWLSRMGLILVGLICIFVIPIALGLL
ncbi:MAG: TRAP transporter permease DctM/Q, partial [Hyphomicrobiaceae bacterium]